MDERAALALVADVVSEAGDDAAVVDGHVLTVDMLHESTDFPEGTSHYTVGWRAVGASLSDVAAMGAAADAAVAVYAAPAFEDDELAAFLDGASDVCATVDASYVGGDLDTHSELTVSTTVLGSTERPVFRSGAEPGDLVAVTGTLGRSAAGLRAFEAGAIETGNDLFQFQPRVHAGRALAPYATAMMDSSDGLARSLHQLAESSDCGFEVSGQTVPVDDAVEDWATGTTDRQEMALSFGEDFELVFTIPETDLKRARKQTTVALSVVGTVTESGVTLDGDPLPDRGYTHGE